MKYYPLFADLRDRDILLVGGGEVAARKASALLAAGASLRVSAPTLHPDLQDLYAQHKIDWQTRHYQSTDIRTAFLVIVATDDQALSQRVFADAEANHTLVNVVDNQALCTFIVPAIVDRSPLQIAVSSAGTSPVLARLIRQKLESELPHYLGKLAAMAGKFRSQVKAKLNTSSTRRRFWEDLLQSKKLDFHLANNNPALAQQTLRDALDNHVTTAGEVVLVGAGPGDPELLTLAALQAMQAADIILYDALVSDEVLALVRRDAEKIHVGKRVGNHRIKQQQTNELMIAHARAGKRVVRLKGGDPFMFGRGGEELQALQKAGIAFRVVPGITAAAGAAAYAGIPLTHRDHAQTTVFITGHCRPQGHEIDWQAMAMGQQTLVIYMGTLHAADISRQLLAFGRQAQTPAAIISHGTRPTQSVRKGTLADLSSMAKDAPRPALIVIGEVVELQTELAWFAHHADNEK